MKILKTTAALMAAVLTVSAVATPTVSNVTYQNTQFVASAQEAATTKLFVQITNDALSDISISGVEITATDNDGYVYTAQTNANGLAYFGELPVARDNGSVKKYTVDIPSPPKGYRKVVYEGNEYTLTANVDMTVKLPLYTASYKVSFKAADNYTTSSKSSGDAKINGATFGIYKDGVLYKTLTSDANGNLGDVSLENLDWDAKWTAKLIEASEGYCVDTKERDLSSTMKNFPEYSAVETTLGMTPITGYFRIGANPGDEIEVYLQSAGSYAKASEKERASVTIEKDSSNVLTNQLAYGTYVVTNKTTGEITTAKITDNMIIVPVSFSGGSTQSDILLTIESNIIRQKTELGDADYDKLEYALKVDGTEVARYTLPEIESGKATYKVLGNQRSSKWTIEMLDNGAGFVTQEYELGFAGLNDNLNGYSFKLNNPILIHSRLTIKGTPGDEVEYYLASQGSYENCVKLSDDCDSCEKFVLDSTGTYTTIVPYGTYVIRDLTTNYTHPLKQEAKSNGKSISVTLLANPNPNTSTTTTSSTTSTTTTTTTSSTPPTTTTTKPIQNPVDFELEDMFGNKVATGVCDQNANTLPVPEGQTATKIYKFIVTVDLMGDKFTRTSYIVLNPDGTYTSRQVILGDADGDGQFALNDLVATQKALLGEEPLKSMAAFEAVDLMPDGVFDVFDMVVLRQLAAKYLF